MKPITTNNLTLRSCMAFAAMVAIYIPVPAWSADPVEEKDIDVEETMVEKCEVMKLERQKMQAEMKAQDDELTAAIGTMNNAAKEEKLDLIAGVLTQMVEQRTAMHAHKAKMEEMMMKHMMGHMEMGMESMSKCPMMMEMRGMDETSAESHEERHKDQE